MKKCNNFGLFILFNYLTGVWMRIQFLLFFRVSPESRLLHMALRSRSAGNGLIYRWVYSII